MPGKEGGEDRGGRSAATGMPNVCGVTTDVHTTARLAANSGDGGNGEAALSDSREVDPLLRLTAQLRHFWKAENITELEKVLQALQRLTVSVESLMVSDVVALLRQLRGVTDSSVATEADTF